MGQLVFQATLGGQVNLVGPNTASTFNLNVPAVSSTLATLTGTETFTNKTLTSPTLTTPVLGTPASGTLTNCTGLPNAGLVNSSVTVGSTAIALGATATTVAGLTSLATNTLTSASATALTLQSAGTTAITVNTSQNVGIGSTTPSAFGGFKTLAIGGDSGSSTSGVLQFINNGTEGLRIVEGSTAVEIIENRNIAMVLGTNATERMRIDSSGKVTVGSTAQTKGNLNLYGPASTQLNLYLFKNTQVEAYMGFNSSDSNLYVNTGATFASTGVYMANGGTSWTTNSDERLKENLVPITDAITKVSSLRTVIGNFIADENKTARPFLIAQDVQAVLPEAISTSTMNETEYLGVSYTDVIPLLVASIKELKAINDTQAETLTQQTEAINALTARIVALEAK